jgi:hypothetical protein
MVPKDLLPSCPLAGTIHDRRRGKPTVRQLRHAQPLTLYAAELPAHQDTAPDRSDIWEPVFRPVGDAGPYRGALWRPPPSAVMWSQPHLPTPRRGRCPHRPGHAPNPSVTKKREDRRSNSLPLGGRFLGGHTGPPLRKRTALRCIPWGPPPSAARHINDRFSTINSYGQNEKEWNVSS